MKTTQIRQALVTLLIAAVVFYALVIFWPYFLLKGVWWVYLTLGQSAGLILGRLPFD